MKMKEIIDLDNDLAKEILTVLAYLDNTFINNLSNTLLVKLTDLAADSTKNFYIQKNKKLDEQNLSEECKNWLSLFYYKFSNSSEKNEIINSWFKNDIRE